jgi:hypothetical protein
LHDYSGVETFIDEESLSEPTTEVVTRYIAKIFVSSSISGGLSRSTDRCSDTTSCEINKWIIIVEAFITSKLVEISLNIGWEIRISGFSFPSISVFASRDTEAIVIPVIESTNMLRANLRNLEGS